MKINSVSSLMKFMLTDHKLHVFRGQREAQWPLESSMTRTLKANPRLVRFGASAEQFTIRQFTKNAHLYDEAFQHFKSCEFATLTYIQHHGAPTRLLDLTSSKFIALFFAFDGIDLSTGSKYARIWYFKPSEVSKKTKELAGIPDDYDISADPGKTWTDHIKGNGKDALFVMTPDVNSRRSHIQSGSFICSGNIQKSIHEIYEAEYKSLINFVDINKTLYEDVSNLLREVNLSHSTLYGGIDSYSKDIRNRLVTIK